MASLQDYVALSSFVYNDARGEPNKIEKPDNWAELPYSVSSNPSGFTASAFQRGNEIVIAFKGTDFLFGTNNAQTLADLRADVRLGAGFGAAQLTEAVLFYQQIKNQYPDADISFTGHSLGGGLASILSVWFGESSTIFANAPFKLSALNIGLIQNVLASPLLTNQEIKNQLASLLTITDVPNPLPGQPTQTVLINQNVYDERKSLIENHYIQGEVLSSYFPSALFLAGNNNPIRIGGGDQVSSITLHSIILHAALKLEELLQVNTVNLPNLIPTIFSKELYARELAFDESDFLTKLLNDQIKLGYTTENGLLHQFALDTAKISGGLALENNLLNKALIAAVIEDYYFMEDGFTKAFFDKVAGGIGFDLNDIETDDPLSDNYLINALKDLTQADYDTLAIDNIRDYKWYVPTGTQTLTVKPDDGAVLMLGGQGND